jgi:hypothetical protein
VTKIKKVSNNLSNALTTEKNPSKFESTLQNARGKFQSPGKNLYRWQQVMTKKGVVWVMQIILFNLAADAPEASIYISWTRSWQ